MIRTALDLPADADVATMVAAINAATADPVEDAKAKAISDAINAESAMPTDLAQTDDELRIAIDGLSATDQGADNLADGEDANADTELTKSMDSDALMDAGFAGAVFTTPAPEAGATAPVMTDTVYVYTNRGPNIDQEWTAYFDDLAVNGAGDGVSSAPAGSGDNTLNSLDIDLTEVSDNSDLFASASLPTTPGTFVEWTDDDMTGDVDERMFAGTFRGVPGMYGCDATTCRAQLSNDGELSLSGGAWTFTPTEPGDDQMVMVAGVLPDTDYLTFGFWALGRYIRERGSPVHA